MVAGFEDFVVDDVLRRRLGRRYEDGIGAWLDGLPGMLASLGQQWRLTFDSVIQRGNVSVVLRCRTAAGEPAVLKVSPDRARIRDEAVALAGWDTGCVPAVLAVDHEAGALLLEAIEPGTPLDLLPELPRAESLSRLVASLHRRGTPSNQRPLTDRITALFESGRRNYERRPDLAALVAPALYESGRQLAMRLAIDGGTTVVLHGDLTPANIVDGGAARGLVAIDPAPCLGDPAFDLVDLLLWRAEDQAAVTTRAENVAPGIGVPVERALAWCAAFAPMTVLELAEAAREPPTNVDWLLALARATSAGH